MPSGGGFYSEEHEANFRSANVRFRRGGPAEVVCGARTRTGGTCRGKPLSGSTRCLKHAGPHASRAFRERQLHDLRQGKITSQEFAAHEARRAVNRLRDNWKKNAWLPGGTIDLGESEWVFQEESGIARRGEPLPPAVLDWLRWKYRRLQIDRKRDAEWVRVLHEELPVRVRDAGPPSTEDLATIEQRSASVPALWTADSQGQFSKRQNVDQPKVTQPKPAPKLPRAPMHEPDPGDMAAVCARHYALLNPLFGNCRDAAEKRSVMLALYAYVVDPADAANLRRWTETVRVLLHAQR